MRRRRIFLIFVLLLCGLAAGAAWWVAGWIEKRPLAPSGGLYFPVRAVLPVPLFRQGDPRWADEPLATTPRTLAAEGCAVTSAAMVLAAHGIDVDPARLNAFLTALPGGYTPEGWIYWEKAALYDPAFAAKILPHYEDAASYFLIDANLLRGNPVIARLRHANGITHFVVISGKQGFDYLINDPGPGSAKGTYPLRDFGSKIEAIRFFQKP